MIEAFLGLGSNVGDRAGHLKAAAQLLDETTGIWLREVSSIYRTAPVGKIEQEDFFNAVIRIESTLEPLDLLDRCLEIERSRGRERNERWGPRTLDIDLLLYGATEMNAPRLALPHPEIAKRAFVLVPLVELQPEANIGSRVAVERLKELDVTGVEKLLPFQESQTVAIIGASSKPERYSYQAQAMLESYGHSVVPVNPATPVIRGTPARADLEGYAGKLDTATLYVGPSRQSSVIEDLIRARPKRVIFNPGTECSFTRDALRESGIPFIEACTLVMLRAEQF